MKKETLHDPVYGTRCGALLAYYDPESSSLKTSELLLTGDSMRFSAPLPKSGTMLHGRIYAQRTWALRIGGSASGSWPTPQASDPINEKRRSKDPSKAERPTDLARRVHKWHTPRASDVREAWEVRSPGGGQRKHPIPNLALEARIGEPYALMSEQKRWPTPSARDWKDTPGMSATAINKDGTTRDRTDQFARAVYFKGDEEEDAGEEVVEEAQSTQAGSGTPQMTLNPAWVEWLMGYPGEWTGSGDWAIALSRRSPS
jgi:hypothetical protein